MSKQEIRVGQQWTEKGYNRRVMEVQNENEGQSAPGSAPPRRIALPIAPATATHCGTAFHPDKRCNSLYISLGWVCGAFAKKLPEGSEMRRLPECIASEVRNG